MDIGMILSPQAFLYDFPAGTVADEVLSGWAVGIKAEEGDYYRVVTHYGYEGYISRKDIRRVDEKNFLKRMRENRQVIVRSLFLDVLETPSVQSKILTTLCRGSVVRASDEIQDKYIKVEAENGVIGYVPNTAVCKRLDNDNFFLSDKGLDFFLGQRIDRDREKEIRNALVQNARNYLGVPYRWGGKSPMGIDCSGMVFMCYMLCGILIFRDSRIEKCYPVRQIPISKAREGDLLYFPGHVGMCIGEGRFIHCTAHRDSFCCVINSLVPGDIGYRADLASSALCAGTVFAN